MFVVYKKMRPLLWFYRLYTRCASSYIVESNKASVIFGSKGRKNVVIPPQKRNPN